MKATEHYGPYLGKGALPALSQHCGCNAVKARSGPGGHSQTLFQGQGPRLVRSGVAHQPRTRKGAHGEHSHCEGYGVLMAERPACRVRVNTELFPSWCSR